ncbi:hypothetical protein Bca52824_004961 [Brassica carinata]|uniref:Exportin-1 C-terminal domain-containing protein n=1 Tax=Brassica carinata TaxID=52824 RepID=A0A8X7WP54_BRACI|nr:hypothetical protein Bca52824_004961 [Brassica carinata]
MMKKDNNKTRCLTSFAWLLTLTGRRRHCLRWFIDCFHVNSHCVINICFFFYLCHYLILVTSTTAAEVTQFVNGLYESRNDPSEFKKNIRDFLVQSKEFSAQDNKDLYAEEAAAQREQERQRMLSIPGLVAPNEIQDEMVDS